jgi:hypothetical protein
MSFTYLIVMILSLTVIVNILIRVFIGRND